MKKLLFFMVLTGTVALTSCSKDNDDTDAIVGTWVNESSFSVNDGEEQTSLVMWIFNADSSGSYSEASNGTVETESDFTWTRVGSQYQVDYSNTEISDDIFIISELLGQDALEDEQGFTVAIRQ